MAETSGLDEELLDLLTTAQRNEMTEHKVYRSIAKHVPDPDNRETLHRIAADEMRHYEFLRQFTQQDISPRRLEVAKYTLMARLLGITFAIKLMERGEKDAQGGYGILSQRIPEIKPIVGDETEHEAQLIELLDEERLHYVGAFVLGLSDALVELTGALAGFTLALQSTRLVAVTGLITGIAASLSMSASEYLSEKSEGGEKEPLKAALYTGTAYTFTVLFLVLPYLVLLNVYYSLIWTITNAIIIILVFTFYVSVARGVSFRRRFCEMAGISLGVAGLTFVIGYLVRVGLGVEV